MQGGQCNLWHAARSLLALLALRPSEAQVGRAHLFDKVYKGTPGLRCVQARLCRDKMLMRCCGTSLAGTRARQRCMQGWQPPAQGYVQMRDC